ncbi:large-conductance mechanosensitive channel protein MscL [Bacillus sp. AFS041924]|uniref:large-conductance mechanosensitive channel protein MscL n=1 Tax=Bacillus sp. AFS041924 TaxID=2033503 RepID=UPI000BFE473C|nr:large-conductance mechanosensitive channel protein MscL [Bacillus sp. AFS041924]PGS55425.1 large conductance mechanosensitive channel protein MscL [Bacillus sp. AFS041924]
MFEEFKKFALKGNVLDLAVGVIIGGAFGKIVSSLVADIMMPVIGLIIGKSNFTGLVFHEIKYGSFIQTVIDFLIISISVFFFVRLLNRLSFRKKVAEEAKPVVPTKEEALLIEIRDLLKEQVKNQKDIS